MSPFVIGLVGLGVSLVLMFIGVPIAFSFLLPGFVGVVFIVGWDAGLSVLGSAIVANAGKEMLVSIPLFVLMGYFVLVSELGEDVYRAAYKLMGRTPGGLAQATTIACAGFAACTGDSVGASATMSAISYPHLSKYGYDKRLATGCSTVGGTLGVLIPPSIPMITYGYLASVSAGSLFIAGIIPGILTTIALMGVTFVWCVLRPQIAPKAAEKYTVREKLRSINGGVWGIVALFLLVILGLYFGVFAPSEAGAVGAMGAFVITIFRHKLTRRSLVRALKGAGEITCYLFTMLIGAMVFQTLLVTAGFAEVLQNHLVGWDVSPYIVLSMVVVIWLIMGALMDELAIQLLTVPIFAPIMASLGFDLIWFGVISILCAEIGMVAPPVGLNVFVVSGVTKVPSATIFRGIAPYCLALLLVIIILTIFPQLATWLPSMMMN
jgi:tripartite ATP-independent transporter DctM subunit